MTILLRKNVKEIAKFSHMAHFSMVNLEPFLFLARRLNFRVIEL